MPFPRNSESNHFTFLESGTRVQLLGIRSGSYLGMAGGSLCATASDAASAQWVVDRAESESVPSVNSFALINAATKIPLVSNGATTVTLGWQARRDFDFAPSSNFKYPLTLTSSRDPAQLRFQLEANGPDALRVTLAPPTPHSLRTVKCPRGHPLDLRYRSMHIICDACRQGLGRAVVVARCGEGCDFDMCVPCANAAINAATADAKNVAVTAEGTSAATPEVADAAKPSVADNVDPSAADLATVPEVQPSSPSAEPSPAGAAAAVRAPIPPSTDEWAGLVCPGGHRMEATAAAHSVGSCCGCGAAGRGGDAVTCSGGCFVLCGACAAACASIATPRRPVGARAVTVEDGVVVCEVDGHVPAAQATVPTAAPPTAAATSCNASIRPRRVPNVFTRAAGSAGCGGGTPHAVCLWRPATVTTVDSPMPRVVAARVAGVPSKLSVAVGVTALWGVAFPSAEEEAAAVATSAATLSEVGPFGHGAVEASRSCGNARALLGRRVRFVSVATGGPMVSCDVLDDDGCVTVVALPSHLAKAGVSTRFGPGHDATAVALYGRNGPVTIDGAHIFILGVPASSMCHLARHMARVPGIARRTHHIAATLDRLHAARVASATPSPKCESATTDAAAPAAAVGAEAVFAERQASAPVAHDVDVAADTTRADPPSKDTSAPSLSQSGKVPDVAEVVDAVVRAIAKSTGWEQADSVLGLLSMFADAARK